MKYHDEDVDSPLYELLARRVDRIWIGPGEHVLVIETDQGRLAWEAMGDCCSESWFAELIGVAALLGGTVSDLEELSMGTTRDRRSRQDEDQIYGVALTTEKGTATLVFRNSSNGYYGGDLRVIRPPGTAGFREITTEWSS